LNDQMERFDEEEEKVISLTEEKKKLLKDIQDLEDGYVTTCSQNSLELWVNVGLVKFIFPRRYQSKLEEML